MINVIAKIINIKCTEIDLISGSGHGLGNIETLPKTSIIIDKNTIHVMEQTLTDYMMNV